MSRARAEATRRSPHDTEGYTTSEARNEFTAGTSWLAEELLSDEAVETACEAAALKRNPARTWDTYSEVSRHNERLVTRAALTAALEAVK